MATRLFDGTRSVGDGFVLDGVSFEAHQCGACGVFFAIEATFMDARRENHQRFVCPLGHGYVFKGESEKERLRRERDEAFRSANSTRDLLRHEERAHAATKGHLTRTKKERDRMHAMIEAGQCPVPGCRRHFKNVAAHMARQHPGFKVGE